MYWISHTPQWPKRIDLGLAEFKGVACRGQHDVAAGQTDSGPSRVSGRSPASLRAHDNCIGVGACGPKPRIGPGAGSSKRTLLCADAFRSSYAREALFVNCMGERAELRQSKLTDIYEVSTPFPATGQN